MRALDGEDIEEIEKCISQCEKNRIPPDDGDIDNARQKIEVLTLRKGILMTKNKQYTLCIKINNKAN